MESRSCKHSDHGSRQKRFLVRLPSRCAVQRCPSANEKVEQTTELLFILASARHILVKQQPLQQAYAGVNSTTDVTRYAPLAKGKRGSRQMLPTCYEADTTSFVYASHEFSKGPSMLPVTFVTGSASKYMPYTCSYRDALSARLERGSESGKDQRGAFQRSSDPMTRKHMFDLHQAICAILPTAWPCPPLCHETCLDWWYWVCGHLATHACRRHIPTSPHLPVACICSARRLPFSLNRRLGLQPGCPSHIFFL